MFLLYRLWLSISLQEEGGQPNSIYIRTLQDFEYSCNVKFSYSLVELVKYMTQVQLILTSLLIESGSGGGDGDGGRGGDGGGGGMGFLGSGKRVLGLLRLGGVVLYKRKQGNR
ncbi:hypothetical protein L3X38_025497 [Prunus dulcis]|uniref:Uncharacterized protein n=1 Tax=Prunus dulcis TaxID=3755 RepID=A0AAD4Z7H2_PRUDU|nr:hypothetical protein L3X38_025497 [Prunus dulcis]